MVIGVSALVVILSFIDGLEKFARSEISRTSSLNAIMIGTVTGKEVDGVYMRKDSVAALDATSFERLIAGLNVQRHAISTNVPSEVEMTTDSVRKIGVVITATTVDPLDTTGKVAYGRLLTVDDITNRSAVAMINGYLAKRAAGNADISTVLGKTIRWRDQVFTVVGIEPMPEREDMDKAGQVRIPLSLLSVDELHKHPPSGYVEAAATELVNPLKDSLRARVENLFPGRGGDFEFGTNSFRVDQLETGFALFRIIMGLIIGVSVIVGGVGVMNVLLISVNERTVEIGVRKALGATKRDILKQFLMESIAVSGFGSTLGLIFGILMSMIAAPIVRALSKSDIFEPAYTWNTMFVVAAIAVLIGIIFGTYPAAKAAKLDPVEAIRRE
jgi:putative ABC transport system permease protein